MSAVLSLTSSVMTLVNVFTGEYMLMIATLLFSLLCLANILAIYRFSARERIVYWLFGLEAMALLAFFMVTGIPDGFSVLWVCLIPSFALLVFGLRSGSIFSALTLVMVIFLFWLPSGRTLLRYDYSSVFMLRFPFFYISAYLLSLTIEYVRAETQRQLETARQEYAHLYRHDALTGLYNRYGIYEFCRQAFHGEEGEHAAVVLFDIDDFKRINDTYSHMAGDEVLKTVSAIVQRTVCENCSCCRWGGEEFLLVLRCRHDARETAEKLRREIVSTPTVYQNEELHVTASFGVSVAANLCNLSITDLIDRADKAMYVSKANGRNCVTVQVL